MTKGVFGVFKNKEIDVRENNHSKVVRNFSHLEFKTLRTIN